MGDFCPHEADFCSRILVGLVMSSLTPARGEVQRLESGVLLSPMKTESGIIYQQ